MKTTEVISIGDRQAVTLPDEFRFTDATVSIRREGQAIILEPVKAEAWPAGFFESIRIDDPAFARPPQGQAPPAPPLPPTWSTHTPPDSRIKPSDLCEVIHEQPIERTAG